MLARHVTYLRTYLSIAIVQIISSGDELVIVSPSIIYLVLYYIMYTTPYSKDCVR